MQPQENIDDRAYPQQVAQRAEREWMGAPGHCLAPTAVFHGHPSLTGSSVGGEEQVQLSHIQSSNQERRQAGSAPSRTHLATIWRWDPRVADNLARRIGT